MEYIASTQGTRIDAVLKGVDPELIQDNRKLEQILYEALLKDDFHIDQKAEKVFTPQGYTLLVVLEESDANIHTYPEYGNLVFHLYSCRKPGDGKNTWEHLLNVLKPEQVEYEEKTVDVSPLRLES